LHKTLVPLEKNEALGGPQVPRKRRMMVETPPKKLRKISKVQDLNCVGQFNQIISKKMKKKILNF